MKPVDRCDLARRIADDEAVVEELSLDGLDSAPHAFIGRRKEADQGLQQEAGVELTGPIGLCEGVALGVETLVTHLAVDLSPQPLPALGRAIEPEPRRRPAAHFPDPVVGLSPV